MRNLILFLLIIVLIRCDTTTKAAENVISRLLPDFSSKKYIVVIPYNGCTSCINRAKKYLFENIDKITISHSFIISRVSDKKIVRNEFSKFLNHPALCIDFENLVLKYYDSDYPIIIWLDNGHIIKTEEIQLNKMKIWDSL